MMHIGIEGYAIRPEERKDAPLVFGIDLSCSMDLENRLGLVKWAWEPLVNQLRPVDSVGIVVYGGDARVAPGFTGSHDGGAILESIYSLRPRGASNVKASLQLAHQVASGAFRPRHGPGRRKAVSHD